VSDLLASAVASLVAAWEQFAAWSPGARVQRDADAATALFVADADRALLNNALVLGDPERALTAITEAYASAGIDRYAIWIHETQHAAQALLEREGYRLAERTMVMGAQLPAPGPAHVAQINTIHPSPAGLRAVNELADDVLPGLAHGGPARILLAGPPPQSGLLALDHDGDCALAFVATLPKVRKRGMATALTARALADAAARGCTSASLQATPEAEGVYRAAGFRDLGRIREYER
jgi:GNAT superfamily N-acetyltransferase